MTKYAVSEFFYKLQHSQRRITLTWFSLFFPKVSYPILSAISSAIASETSAEDQAQQIKLLTSTDDYYGGVTVELDHPMDSSAFIPVLRASVSHWKQLVDNLST